jgi:hypothetical protein
MDPLASLREQYPEGSTVTLHRIDGGKEHKNLLAPFLGLRGPVIEHRMGAKRPQMLVVFGMDWVWLYESEVRVFEVNEGACDDTVLEVVNDDPGQQEAPTPQTAEDPPTTGLQAPVRPEDAQVGRDDRGA